jgi:hypothetical protein
MPGGELSTAARSQYPLSCTAGEGYSDRRPQPVFHTLYEPVHSLAQRLGIEENWLFGLVESGWLDEHNRELNDPFEAGHLMSATLIASILVLLLANGAALAASPAPVCFPIPIPDSPEYENSDYLP